MIIIHFKATNQKLIYCDSDKSTWQYVDLVLILPILFMCNLKKNENLIFFYILW